MTLSKEQEKRRTQLYRCRRCKWTGTWSQHGRNPNFGYIRCPMCAHQGYDMMTDEHPSIIEAAKGGS
jgi:DNA-directed RNA polymerase subunit RPC12/RpoP